jgi:beta-glucosidase/6-phospho-beta-glucosidase/beta-galactosidase
MRHKDYRRTNRALLQPARLKLLFHFWLLSSVVLSALSPVIAQRFSLEEWADETRAMIDTVDDADLAEDTRFNAPVYLDLPGKDVEVGTREDQERIAQTVALYQALIGRDTIWSLLWTGVESANPLTRDEQYRWNSLRDQDLYNPDNRRKLAAILTRLGIVNLRIGMSNHEIDLADDATWRDHDALIQDLSNAGLNLSLDLHHFGIEDRFRVIAADGTTVGPKSYYLHPDWPDYFARFAGKAFARYGERLKAVTLINEPETTVGFASQIWNGGFPGWDSPLHHFYYIERAIQVAKAAVKARTAIEADLRRSGHRVLFVHTEAAVYKPDWEDFNRFIRFLPSDLILGQDWLMNANLNAFAGMPMDEIVGRWQRTSPEQRTSLDWRVENYVVSSQLERAREANRKRLIGLLRNLRDLHLLLQEQYGKSMRADTVFAVDYYAHNEDHGPGGMMLESEPQYYAMQIALGNRAGLYSVMVDYFNRYMMPIMVGETGTPYHHYGARWNQQLLLECARAVKDGIPFLGYTIYPLIDTWGWETALSVPKDQTLLNPGGLITLDLEVRPFVERLLQSLSGPIQPCGPSDSCPELEVSGKAEPAGESL